jgi:Bacterial Ig-like domain (group 1)
MKKAALISGFLLFALIFSARSLPARAADVNACQSGTINSDTTWSIANSPVEICVSGVTVAQGATLTVDPGVTVKFDNSTTNSIYVQGALSAIGTPTQPVTFTGMTASPGSWGGLSVDAVGTPARLTLDHAVLQYGGINGPYGAQVYADRGQVSIGHSTLASGAGNGLYTTVNTTFAISNTAFTDNGRAALFLASPATDLLMTHLTASGNGTDAVVVSGNANLHGQKRWMDPGIPFMVDAPVGNVPGDILTIEPGVDMRFTPNGYLGIGGQLTAIGTPSQPITMTSTTSTPNTWRGIVADGGTTRATVQLDYVTIEYAGSDIHGANIELTDGYLIVHHSIIRNSGKDGVRLDFNAGGSILQSQVYGNGLYGIYNGQTTRPILAANNWWGDPGGPQSDIPACPSGNGDKVTAGVLYQPVLTDTVHVSAMPLSNYPVLSLSPRRWFAPADGLTKIYFDISLHDSNGMPIPGRVVRLHSTLGSVVDGGITDAYGKTLAYLTSTSTGDATVNATLDPVNACEAALSPESSVTFNPINPSLDLLPDGQAPYFNGNISVAPLPVVVGVTETISAKLTNPLTVPVTVDVEFGFAQSGIGLVFGPIKDITGQVIPANSSVVDTAQVVPIVAGHYCVQVSYTLVGIGGKAVDAPQAGELQQFNWNAQPASTGGSGKDNSLDKTRNSLKAVNHFVSATYRPNPFSVPLAVANQGIAWDLNNAEKISNALQGDPPRQDYTVIDTPHVLQLPHVQAGGSLTQAHADALNALDDALAQANAYGTAAAIAYDRMGGATAAADLNWSSIQSGVMLQYNQLMGSELITASVRIHDLVNEVATEGITSVNMSVSDVITMQQQLAGGFTAQQIADAHTVGLTDADIEAIRQSIITANPTDLAGDVIQNMLAIADQFNDLGYILQHPYAFVPLAVGGSAGFMAQTNPTNAMAQVYNSSSTFLLANPLGAQTQITLKVRRLDLPADWGVTASPLKVTLDPGQQVMVTVNIVPGSPLPQGSRPRVAVEAYAGSTLLGGVVIEVLVPLYRPFDGFLRVYAPVIEK